MFYVNFKKLTPLHGSLWKKSYVTLLYLSLKSLIGVILYAIDVFVKMCMVKKELLAVYPNIYDTTVI